MVRQALPCGRDGTGNDPDGQWAHSTRPHPSSARPWEEAHICHLPPTSFLLSPSLPSTCPSASPARFTSTHRHHVRHLHQRRHHPYLVCHLGAAQHHTQWPARTGQQEGEAGGDWGGGGGGGETTWGFCIAERPGGDRGREVEWRRALTCGCRLQSQHTPHGCVCVRGITTRASPHARTRPSAAAEDDGLPMMVEVHCWDRAYRPPSPLT